MALIQASWVHGHAMEIEFPDRAASVTRLGFYCRIEGRPNTDNWLHLAVPTPVIVRGQRLRAGVVLLRFRAAGGAFVHAVHVYDGERKIADHNGLRHAPEAFGMERYEVERDPEVQWGIGISLGVRFPAAGARLELASAGCDFVSDGRGAVVVHPAGG